MVRKYMTHVEKLNLKKNFSDLFGHQDPTKLCQSDRDVFCNDYYLSLGQYSKPFQRIAVARYMNSWLLELRLVQDELRQREVQAASDEAARVEKNRRERERKAKKLHDFEEAEAMKYGQTQKRYAAAPATAKPPIPALESEFKEALKKKWNELQANPPSYVSVDSRHYESLVARINLLEVENMNMRQALISASAAANRGLLGKG